VAHCETDIQSHDGIFGIKRQEWQELKATMSDDLSYDDYEERQMSGEDIKEKKETFAKMKNLKSRIAGKEHFSRKDLDT